MEYFLKLMEYQKRCIISFIILKKRMERDTGIEPASQAWEARALPM